MQRLDGRVAIVTGSARGIGRGIADVLAGEGASILVADANPAAAERTAEELRANGIDADWVEVDVTSRDAVDGMAAKAVDRWGRIDILATNAGIYPLDRLEDITDEKWRRVLDVNTTGVLHCVQSCLQTMSAQSFGRIVITSSITGPLTGHPGFAHYGAAKAGVLGFMRSAAIELAGRGITVNAILPGNVRTPGVSEAGDEHIAQMMKTIPMQYFAEPEDLGWAVRFLASAEARYITGQTLVVDGGQTLPEGALDFSNLF